MTSELCTLVQEREREMVECAEKTRDRKLAVVTAIKQAQSKIMSETAQVHLLCQASLCFSISALGLHRVRLVSTCTLNFEE